MKETRLYYLYHAYISRSCEKEEMEEFFSYVADSTNLKSLQEFMKVHFAEINTTNELPDVDWELIYDRIVNEAYFHEETSKRSSGAAIRWLYNWKAAAAVILILGITTKYYIIQQKNVKTNNGKHVNIIVPGSEKATLTLADGSLINLGQLEGRLLSDQDVGTVFKINDGELSYSGQIKEQDSISYNRLSVPLGSTYKLLLADGTKVWLNSASSITYPVAFGSRAREVSVTGEVYFEVAKNPTRPFYVTAKDTRIRVLGTHFNVNVYDNEPEAKIFLEEGSIELTHKSRKKILVPGEEAVLNNFGHLNVRKANFEEILAWKDEFFVFNNRDTEEILRQFARWYKVNLIIKGVVPHFNFDVKLSRRMTLNRIVSILQFYNVNCTIEGNNLIVGPERP